MEELDNEILDLENRIRRESTKPLKWFIREEYEAFEKWDREEWTPQVEEEKKRLGWSEENNQRKVADSISDEELGTMSEEDLSVRLGPPPPTSETLEALIREWRSEANRLLKPVKILPEHAERLGGAEKKLLRGCEMLVAKELKVDTEGYVLFRGQSVHRLVAEWDAGREIPSGIQIDHMANEGEEPDKRDLCPWRLQEVSPKENLLGRDIRRAYKDNRPPCISIDEVDEKEVRTRIEVHGRVVRVHVSADIAKNRDKLNALSAYQVHRRQSQADAQYEELTGEPAPYKPKPGRFGAGGPLEEMEADLRRDMEAALRRAEHETGQLKRGEGYYKQLQDKAKGRSQKRKP